MPLIRIKSNIIVNGGIVEPGTYPKEQLAGADFNHLIAKGVAEVFGDRLWDSILPDEPSSENYVEEIQRMQAIIESQAQENDTLKKTADELRAELRKAADKRPLNRFHAPEAGELESAREDAKHWKQTAQEQERQLQAMRDRNDRYSEQLGGPAADSPNDNPDREPRTTDNPIATAEGTAAPVVDADVITTNTGGSPVRATTKKVGPPTRPRPNAGK